MALREGSCGRGPCSNLFHDALNARAVTSGVEHARSRYDVAVAHYEEALAIYRRTGDETGEANALHGLGGVERRRLSSE